MSGLRALLVLAAALAGCGGPPASWNQRSQNDDTTCNSPTNDGSRCVAAGDWHAYYGRTREAQAAYARGCKLGNLRSCARAIDGGDEEARLRACELGMMGDCVDWLGRARPDDPRRSLVADHLCVDAPDDCLTVIATLRVLGDPEAARLAKQSCERTDRTPNTLAVCAKVAKTAWTDPAFTAALERSGCDAGLGELCWNAAERLPPENATAHELTSTACARGYAPACEAQEQRTAHERAVADRIAACKQGDRQACIRIGKDAARREP